MTAREFQRSFGKVDELVEVNGAVWVPRGHPLNDAVRDLEALGAEPIKPPVSTAGPVRVGKRKVTPVEPDPVKDPVPAPRRVRTGTPPPAGALDPVVEQRRVQRERDALLAGINRKA